MFLCSLPLSLSLSLSPSAQLFVYLNVRVWCSVLWWWWLCVCVVWWWWCVCMCVQYVCVKCMCSVRLFVCLHTRVCVSCVCGLFFIGIIFFICFYLFFYVSIGTDILCIYVYTDRHMFNLFIFLLSSYMHVCAVSFFPFFCLHALNKLFNSYFICFECVWIFLLLLYFLFFVHVYYQ